jgi:pyridoxamine 5'-phosphate oxidase
MLILFVDGISDILSSKMNNIDFSEKTAFKDPFVQFTNWYSEHLEAGIAIPDTVSLGTVSASGRVSLRTVLLKGYDENGFIFFTNYSSRKGVQISENPSSALLFYWPESGRQVRIEGITEKISSSESASYFRTRPRESQISAWASEQSSIIPDRHFLIKRYDFFKNRFENKEVEKPPHWGGYRIVPYFFEFWRDGEFRLHDRIIYTRKNNGWVMNRLAP